MSDSITKFKAFKCVVPGSFAADPTAGGDWTVLEDNILPSVTSKNDSTSPPVAYGLRGYTTNGVVIPYSNATLNAVASGSLNWVVPGTEPSAYLPLVPGCAIDSLNRTVVAGSFSIAPLTILGQSITTALAGSSFVCRFNTNGTLSMLKRLAQTDTGSFAYGLKITSSDGFAISGQVFPPTDFGNGVTVTPTIHEPPAASYDGDIYLVIYDSSGVAQWAKSFGPTAPRPKGQDCASFCLGKASNGDFIVGGYIKGTVVVGGTTLSSSGLQQRAVLFRISANGTTILWAKQFGTGNSDSTNIRSLCVDAADNVWIMGPCESTLNLGDGAINANCFLAKISGTTGLYISGTAHGFNGIVQLNGLATDSQNNVYAGAHVAGANDWGNGKTTPVPGGGFLVKFNQTGQCQWAKNFQTITSSDFDCVNGVIVALGNVFICGLNGAQGSSFDGVAQSIGNYMASFTSSGTLRWKTMWTGNGYNQAPGPTGIAADGLGRVSMCGWFNATVNFGNGNVSSSGSLQQFFTANYQQ